MIRNVIKRNGTVEELKTCKIKEVISWACAGLEVNPLELESKVEGILKDNISTVEIHDHIIYHAQSLARLEATDWVYVAGRLNTMKLWKDTRAYELDFHSFIEEMKKEGKYLHPNLDRYSKEEVDTLETYINQNADLEHSYGSTLTAQSKYLLDGEVIQYMFMVEAMIIFANKPIHKVIELYKALSERKISLATPWLSSLRSNGNISSCFIVSMDDDLESITDTWKKAAKISKMGGGLGIYLGNLRAKGASINGKLNAAKSVSACVKVLNDIAVYIDQGGKRAGAFTPALPVWHNDIEEFLEIQAEHGDPRSKSYDIFPQVCTPDLFWQIDKVQGDWYTFCPKEAKELGYNLNDCYGDEFNYRYNCLVELAKNGSVRVFSVSKARDLVKKIMRTQFETGLPYITFTDALNRENPNKHEGIIPCFNLCTESTSVLDPYNYSHTCLTGDTLILTDKGLRPIEDCEGADVVVPYEDDQGDTYKELRTEKAVLLEKGEQDVFEITLKSGNTIKATKDHKFLTDVGYKEVSQMKEGDFIRVPKELTNITKGHLKEGNPEARLLGWIMGDGWTRESNIGVCFGGDDVQARKDVVKTAKCLYKTICHEEPPKVYKDKNGVNSWQTKSKAFTSYLYDKYGLTPKTGKEKRITKNILSENDNFKREFLSALFTADGSVVNTTNSRNKGYVCYSSASKGLLQDIQLMLLEYGIVSNFSFAEVKGRETSQGNLSIKGFKNLNNFNKYIGFNLSENKTQKLLEAIENASKQDSNRKYTKIRSISYVGKEKVYDLCLKDRHHFIANGFVSHNCNLASLVVGRLEEEELMYYAGLLVEVLDEGIDLTSPPTDCSKRHNNRYRTIGVGIQGYHDWVAKNYSDYYDKELATKLAEHIQFGCVAKSIELAKEKGAYPAFKGSEWDNGNIFAKYKERSVTNLNWSLLEEGCKRYGIRNSQMTSPAPNTSTSVFMDAAAGVPPVYAPFFREDNDNGKYPITCMYIKENPLAYMKSFKTYDQSLLSGTVGAMQEFVDTGISAEYLFDQNKEGFTAKDLYNLLQSSYENNCKAIYYIRSIKKGETVEDLLGIKESGCEGCEA